MQKPNKKINESTTCSGKDLSLRPESFMLKLFFFFLCLRFQFYGKTLCQGKITWKFLRLLGTAHNFTQLQTVLPGKFRTWNIILVQHAFMNNYSRVWRSLTCFIAWDNLDPICSSVHPPLRVSSICSNTQKRFDCHLTCRWSQLQP